MKIENVVLEEDHIGSKVTYIPPHANGNASHKDSEGGRIKRWNDKFVFVQAFGSCTGRKIKRGAY